MAPRAKNKLPGTHGVSEAKRRSSQEANQSECNSTAKPGSFHRAGNKKRGDHQPNRLVPKPAHYVLVFQRFRSGDNHNGQQNHRAHGQRSNQKTDDRSSEYSKDVPTVQGNSRRRGNYPSDQRNHSAKSQAPGQGFARLSHTRFSNISLRYVGIICNYLPHPNLWRRQILETYPESRLSHLVWACESTTFRLSFKLLRLAFFVYPVWNLGEQLCILIEPEKFDVSIDKTFRRDFVKVRMKKASDETSWTALGRDEHSME